MVHVAEFFKIFIAQNRAFQLDLAAALGFGLEKITLGAEIRFRRSHNFFADTINRRIRNLREKLLEVTVQKLRTIG